MFGTTKFAVSYFQGLPNIFIFYLAQRNWLEQWWVEKAYLEYRAPLTVQNFAGLMDIPELWPLKSGTQVNSQFADNSILILHA